LSAGDAEPISPGEAEGLFACLLDHRAVLLAVSGGRDSVALMLLAARWRAARPGGPALAVATVDHGLRPASAGEAALVGRWAQDLGLPHAVLAWPGDKPRTGLQSKAREARYGLLVRHAAGIGADALVTAHHADDQAETVLMRLLRGSGVAGLAGMAKASRRGPLVHRRPLLDIPRARLAATLAEAGQAFCEDPSNADPRFARTRIRSLLGRLSGEGLARDGLLTLAARAARAEDALSQASEAAFSRLAETAGEGVRLGPGLFDEPSEIRLRALLRGIDSVRPAGKDHIRLKRAEDLSDALARAAAEKRAIRTTCAGCVVSLDRLGAVTIMTEKERRRGGSRQG
jgi:tRNA(Ile)-lysidine synthase